MNYNASSTSPQLGRNYLGRSNIDARPRMDSLSSNPPYVHRPDHLHMNPPGRPPVLRAPGTYSGAPSNPSAALYPAHLQSLAPRTYPNTGPLHPGLQSNPNPQPTYTSPIHANRVATLPNPPSQGRAPTHQQYYHEDHHPQLPSYPGPPPPFDYIPPATQAFSPPPNGSLGPTSAHGETIPQLSSSPVPESLLLQTAEHSNFQDPPAASPNSPEDEAELALAIALSEKMVVMEQEREDQRRKQEDEEFERALAQSMLETSTYGGAYADDTHAATSSKVKLDSPTWETGPSAARPDFGAPQSSSSYNGQQSPRFEIASGVTPVESSSRSRSGTWSSVAAGKQPALPNHNFTTSPSQEPSALSPHRYDADGPTSVPSRSGTEDRPVLVQEEPEKVFREERHALINFPPNSGPEERPPSPLHILNPLEDEGANPSPVNPSEASSTGAREPGSLMVEPSLVRSESPSELAYYDRSTPATPVPRQSPPPPFDFPSSQTSFIPQQLEQAQPPSTVPARPTSAASTVASTALSLNSDLGPYAQSTTTMTSATSISDLSVRSFHSMPADTYGAMSLERAPSSGSAANSFQSMPVSSTLPRRPSGAAAPVTLVANQNQYIDPDLLLGVTIDFRAPVLLPQLRPMPGAIPNIVSLPYGRCHPLHIQAPSWRHLLKLLARMGNSRFEPTESARTHVRSEGKLRTVVQFVRMHPTGDDWRTILWFSIDHPVPPSLPNAAKYRNPHPDVFPWSYELMDYPMLLRNGNDSPISKTYTIPASESLPYPTLPMTFPNLALYLQAALDFSRQQKDDNNGYRKLAKMVQACYPNMEEPSQGSGDKATVGGLFKRVLKKGNNKKKTGKTNNEETYEYITPFVPDEWG
ncbi:hypothetical protein D9611_002187 [Ephemerocybe angulata]|uniref:Uncharacterized protein n=1 Tax=Ephemerocybe angulata TaxID=980116 RepID=A0A8H5C1G3_9AGAR|nr:hypothetical protein D9611_002187 [Tulosesus angulatus]